VNPKWHFKNKHFNVKTAGHNSFGPLMSKNFMLKKVLAHLCAAKIAVQKHAQILETETVVATEVQDNLSLSLVPIVGNKTQYLSNREVTVQSFAEIVSDNKEELNKASLLGL
jgi:hypothetical protein